MIRPSEHGLVMRRERNPIIRALGGHYYVEPADGSAISIEQLRIISRIAGGELVDENDPGVQFNPTTNAAR